MRMESISVNRFRDNLKALVERVTTQHLPLKVTRRGRENFVVISEEDWEREQESLYVLQNSDLMRQIGDSLRTHEASAGYKPTRDELNEITDL
jgi:antitoxin YefM